MTRRPHAVPLIADYSAVRTRPADALIRTILAQVLALSDLEGRGPERIAKQLWPRDRDTEILTKAATAPATTTTSGWASQLAIGAVSDLLVSLGPASAASELFKRVINLDFGVSGAITVPAILAAASNTPFVAEATPFPIKQFVTGGTLLEPRKLATGIVVTRELLSHSTPDVEKLLRMVIIESVGATLDFIMLDANASSTVRPAGLRFNISGLTPTAGGTVDALRKDLGQLATAVAGVGGMQIIFIADPGSAVKIKLTAGPDFDFDVLASNGLASGTVMAIALPALAVAADPAPRIETSTEAIIHAEDTTPLAIAPSPTPITAPVRSLFQTDCVAIKLVFEIGWGLRTTGAVAWLTGVTW